MALFRRDEGSVFSNMVFIKIAGATGERKFFRYGIKTALFMEVKKSLYHWIVDVEKSVLSFIGKVRLERFDFSRIKEVIAGIEIEDKINQREKILRSGSFRRGDFADGLKIGRQRIGFFSFNERAIEFVNGRAEDKRFIAPISQKVSKSFAKCKTWLCPSGPRKGLKLFSQRSSDKTIFSKLLPWRITRVVLSAKLLILPSLRFM
jgi:hypothetical protein